MANPGGVGKAGSLSVKILSFPSSFSQKCCQLISWHTPSGVDAPLQNLNQALRKAFINPVHSLIEQIWFVISHRLQSWKFSTQILNWQIINEKKTKNLFKKMQISAKIFPKLLKLTWRLLRLISSVFIIYPFLLIPLKESYLRVIYGSIFIQHFLRGSFHLNSLVREGHKIIKRSPTRFKSECAWGKQLSVNYIGVSMYCMHLMKLHVNKPNSFHICLLRASTEIFIPNLNQKNNEIKKIRTYYLLGRSYVDSTCWQQSFVSFPLYHPVF